MLYYTCYLTFEDLLYVTIKLLHEPHLASLEVLYNMVHHTLAI